MKKFSTVVKRISSVSIITATLWVADGGTAMANGGNPSIVHACVHNVTSVVRVVGASESCRSGERPFHWSIRGPQGPQGPAGPAGAAVTRDHPVIAGLASSVEWDIAAAASAATSAAYCLANHSWTKDTPEFVSPEHPGGFTASGYELPTLPIVGAVRRNFTRDRLPGPDINRRLQSCSDACKTFLRRVEGPDYRAVALHRRYSDGTVQPDGLNDLGGNVAGTTYDEDFYRDRQKVIAGIDARVDAHISSDVAQTDNCCCGVVSR